MFAQSLDAVIQDSDEVALAGVTYISAHTLSPAGDSAVSYYEAKVIRSWKGSHKVGDAILFGVPAGTVRCGETESHESISFSTMVGSAEWKNNIMGNPLVLFLRQPRGSDTQRVHGLIPRAGAGLQGVLAIQFDSTDEAGNKCTGDTPGTLQWCDSHLQVSQKRVLVPYALDPLAKKYDGMAAF
jgi:hypothetical protein